MNALGWFASGVALGAAMMFATMMILQQRASDVAAERRSAKRRLLGLEDRPARQPGAVGSARITDGNFTRGTQFTRPTE